MEKNLINQIKKSQSEIYPFHMPGHKRNKEFIPLDLLELDVTELDATDNLQEPTGIIKSLENKIAKLYNSHESFILVNGSSCGISAAIMSVCDGIDDEILVARNSHKSVYSGLILSNAKPTYIYPEITGYNLNGGISPNELEKSLQANPKIKAVIITSPTYEGFCSDIKKLAEITQKYNKILIVDEAHGAHFGFHKAFPESAILYADIVIQSLHKTMPVLTQCAVLHINTKKIEPQKIRNCINLLQTTSPSYIFMSSIDYCVEKIIKNQNIYFDKYYEMLYDLRYDLKNTTSLKLIGNELINNNAIFNIDIGKIVINIYNRMTGKELEKILRTEFKIQVEMSGLKHIIAMTSIADTSTGFSRLSEALLTLDYRISTEKEVPEFFSSPISAKKATCVLTPRQAFFSSKTKLDIKSCVGKISGGFLTAYPPGIPLVAPGEFISDEILNTVSMYIEKGLTVMGLFESEGKTKIEIII